MRWTLLLALLSGCGGCSDSLAPDGGWMGLPKYDLAGPPADDAAIAPQPPANGLGANPHPGGTLFRVWAPSASQVFVTGDFNAWSDSANELQPDGNGVFSGDVAGATAGQQYQYLVHHAGMVLTRNDPRARAVTDSKGKSLIVDPTAFAWSAPFQPIPFDQQIIYEMHLGSFNVTTAGQPGTWATAMARLDYLQQLGVNMLEIMPPNEFPGDFSWGYSASIPFATEHAYGSPDDARRFVDAAHAHGMGVIIDVVHNHYSTRDDPLICFDGECPNNKGAYFYADTTLANTPWGPRPNFAEPAVQDYIRDNAIEWLSEYRCDGLRWDSVSNIRGYNNGANANPTGAAMMQAINVALHQQFTGTLQVAEDFASGDVITRDGTKGGAGFDTQWDPAFFHPIDDTVITANDADRNVSSIRDAIAHRYNNTPTQRVVYSEDHDEVANGRSRIPEMISPGNAGSYAARKRSTLAAAIVLTTPGIPMLFMGQEFLENGHFADTNPLDWSKTTTYSGILKLYQDLIALRRNTAGTTRGLSGDNVNVFHVNNTAKVIAYHRWQSGGPGDDVVVIANFADRAFTAYEIGLPRPGTWHARFDSDSIAYSPDYENTPAPDVTTVVKARDGFAQDATVSLGRYEVLILSQ
jgi:1,4-alpha-glucan branching enzyme